MYFLQVYLINPVGQDHMVLLQHKDGNIVSVCFIRTKSDLNSFNCSSVH